MCEFFDKRDYPASVVEAGHHRAQQIDRQSALQTSQKENNNRIPFTLTFHTHNHAVSRIPFLILSFLDFVAFVVKTLISPQNQRKCARFSTNVAMLPPLLKQAIIAPKKLIGSQHYKRLRRRITIEFLSLSHFTFTTTSCQEFHFLFSVS